MIQATLKSRNTFLTTWLDEHKELATGKHITLKGDPTKRQWNVLKLSNSVPQEHINRGWSNNV